MKSNPLTHSARRFLPVAAVGMLVLAACGSDPSSSSSSVDTIPTVTDAPDDGLLAPRPITIATGGNAVAAAPASERSMDMSLMPYRMVTFVAGDGLPVLPTNAVGYLFQAGAAVSTEQVAALAAGLGVTGEPERMDDGYSVWWRVGPDDGTAPMVAVYEDAQLSWNYSSAWATQTVQAGCAVAVSVDAGGAVVADQQATPPVEATAVPAEMTAPPDPGCVEPEPPAGVLTADEAVSRTRELMASLALDPAAFTFEPYADEWSASVSAVEQLDGAFAGRRFDVAFGAEGVLQYASGQLAQPVKVGPYPLIGLDEAIARLNDPSGLYGGSGARYGGGGVVPMGDVAVSNVAPPALGAPTAVDVVESDPATGTASGGGSTGVAVAPEPPLSEPVPVDEMPAPEAVTVTLVDVQADVWWAWDVDGSVWLLPAYRFIGDDGGWYTVPAVTDEFLVQATGDDVPSTVPAPGPAPVPVESTPGGATSEPPITEPALFDAALLEPSIGLTLDEFTKVADGLGASVRVVERDGQSLAATDDFAFSRVNVAVTGEGDTAVVTGIVSVG
jgi:hypothetical protein